MGNIGINNQYTPVSKPSIVRLKMNNGVDNGAGIPPSVQFGKTERGCSLTAKPFTTYNLPKPKGPTLGAPPSGPNLGAPPSGPRFGSFGGLNAANGGQLGNKAVFNLYEMVSLMITLSNSLNRTFREQMAARVVGEISKLHDEARTLTNAAYTARTMGIVSAAVGGTMGFVSLGGTIATGVAAKGASAASGLDAATKNLDGANLKMKPLQDFKELQGDLNSRSSEVLDQMLEKTFTGNEGSLQEGDIATQLEQKTKDIRAFEDNEKTIGELKGRLDADDALKKGLDKPEQLGDKVENKVAEVKEEVKEEEIIRNNENNIDNVNNKKEELIPEENNEVKAQVKAQGEAQGEVQGEAPQGLTQEERDQISKDIKSLEQKNAELDKKHGIRENYCKDKDGQPISPSEKYGKELHDRFEGNYKEAKPQEVKPQEAKPKDVKPRDDESKVEMAENPLDSSMLGENEIEDEAINPFKDKGKLEPGDGDAVRKGFDSEVDGAESLKYHPFDRKAVKEAGAKWLERQDAILRGGSEQVEQNYSNAKTALGVAQNIYKTMMEGSKAFGFTQAVSGMGQGLIPVLQLLTGGAGVNELANAQTKDLQAGERADNYNAGEMQAMKDGLKGIVDGALQVMSTAVSSYAQFQNTVNSNFRV